MNLIFGKNTPVEKKKFAKGVDIPFFSLYIDKGSKTAQAKAGHEPRKFNSLKVIAQYLTRQEKDMSKR
ncbi:MAG: hypothetical protein F6K47_38585 [Symploca sp. SIO2E6]|nr:hypothetical protein [Symploca sp. SIO2E6]